MLNAVMLMVLSHLHIHDLQLFIEVLLTVCFCYFLLSDNMSVELKYK